MTDAEKTHIVFAAPACSACEEEAFEHAIDGAAEKRCPACALALFAAVERVIREDEREGCALAVWNTFVEASTLPQVQKALNDARAAFMAAIRARKEPGR